ncbi:MAG: DEAD/DEAH box helicase family protein [Parcubacteria group bacterium]|jgi:RNA polymerase sigma factor (sigma-70 family)
MSFKLRQYQGSVYDAILDFIDENQKKKDIRGFVVMPSKSGKTIVFSEVAKLMRGFLKKILIVSPTHLIMDQNVKKMRKHDPDANITVYHKGKKDLTGDIVYTTYHSLVLLIKKRLIPKDFVRLVILDEGHRSLSLMRSKIPDYLNAICIAFTATDKFSEQKNVEKVFRNEIYRMTLQEAIEDGILLPLRGYVVETDIDLRKVRMTRKGVLDEEVAEKALNIAARNKVSRDFYLKNFRGIPAVAFCVSINHTIELARYYRKAGIKAYAIHSGTPDRERDRIINAFNKGWIDVLCSRDILIEGWDSERVTVTLNLRPTYSWVVAEQRACRAVAPHEGKTSGIVVEFQDVFRSADQPILVHHIFGNRKYRQGGLVVASKRQMEQEDVQLGRGIDVAVIKDIRVSYETRSVVDIKRLKPERDDFTDPEFVKAILLSREDIDFGEIPFYEFQNMRFDHPKFTLTGMTLMRRYFRQVGMWRGDSDHYYQFMQDVMGDYLFYQRHEVVSRQEIEAQPGENDPEKELESKIINDELSEAFRACLAKLSIRRQRVIVMRFGLFGHPEMTLEEVGAKLNKTREYIRQVESKALRLLRHPERRGRLKEFL